VERINTNLLEIRTIMTGDTWL